MFDVSAEELFDAIDRLVTALLTRHGISSPPVDAVGLAVRAFGYQVREEEEDDEPRRYGDRPKPKPRGKVLAYLPTHSETARNSLAARACAKELIADLLPKLGIAPGTENKSAQGQLVGLIAPRLVLPTRWFATAARKANSDVVRLHDETFPTVAYEWLSLRLLDLDEPCCIAIVDDGSVSTRRSNFAQLTKKLTDAEAACVEKVQTTEEPHTVRKDGWTARGWPIAGGPFNRIILRSVPDDL
jgi:predicted transcriptional regulator